MSRCHSVSAQKSTQFLIISAPSSPIAYAVAAYSTGAISACLQRDTQYYRVPCVCAAMWRGIIERSMTRTFVVPYTYGPVRRRIATGEWCHKLTFNLLSTTPPSSRGSIEQDPTASRELIQWTFQSRIDYGPTGSGHEVLLQEPWATLAVYVEDWTGTPESAPMISSSVCTDGPGSNSSSKGETTIGHPRLISLD